MSDDIDADQSEQRALAQLEIARCVFELDLDDWNKTFLANAIACLSCGLYDLAISDTRMARIPQEQRSPAFAADPQVSALGRQQLAAFLEQLVEQPHRRTANVPAEAD